MYTGPTPMPVRGGPRTTSLIDDLTEMKSESGFSFAIASQPFQYKDSISETFPERFVLVLSSWFHYQMTQNFIVVPETSYLYDPCSMYVRIVTIIMYMSKLWKATLIRVNYDPALAGWEQEFRYEPDVEGLVTVMNKTNGKDIHQVTRDNSFCCNCFFPWDISFFASLIIFLHSLSLSQIRVPPMMITHTLGAYEDPDTNELHFDVLQ